MRILYIVILLVLLPTFSVYSQKKEKKKKAVKSFLREDRNWTFELPIWVPGFRGEYAYGEVSIEGEDGQNPGIPEHPIEPPPPGEPPWGNGNIFNRLFKSSTYLKFFFMSRISYEKNNFLVQADAFSGSIGNNLKFRYNDKTVVQADLSTYLIRFFGGYKLVNQTSANQKFRYELFTFIGVRTHIINLESNLDRIEERIDINPTWFEPLIGVQNQLSMKNWMLVFAIDYGGYFVKEKGSFMINFLAYYKLGNLVSVKAGWTDWDIKHKDEFKGEDLYAKVHLSGPSIGIGFHF